jgi:Ca2+-dependent lipid-binding protein
MTILTTNISIDQALRQSLTSPSLSSCTGSSDPYVKGRIGMVKFRTSIIRRTLNPIWNEEFLVPIVSWNDQTFLNINVKDHDTMSGDDDLGQCQVDLKDYNDGERHEIWLNLESVNSGRLLLALTIWDKEEDRLEAGNIRCSARIHRLNSSRFLSQLLMGIYMFITVARCFDLISSFPYRNCFTFDCCFLLSR